MGQSNWRSKGKGAFAWLLDFLFPRKCVFCGKVWSSDLPCPECQRELPWLLGPEAEGRAEFVTRYAAALGYRDKVRQCVRAMKFRGKAGYLRTLGPITAQCARDHFAGCFDLVTWVPLSGKSLRKRGFDQSRILAQYVAREFEMEPVALFEKHNWAGQQSLAKTAAARRANVLGAFVLRKPELARDRRVLLVDDIVASGATLSECARLLRQAGCREVLAVTCARPVEGKEV